MKLWENYKESFSNRDMVEYKGAKIAGLLVLIGVFGFAVWRIVLEGFIF